MPDTGTTIAPAPVQRLIGGSAWVLVSLKLLVAGALIAWLLRSGRLSLGTLAHVEFGWALLGAGLFRLIALVVPLVRWGMLARVQRLNVTMGSALHIGLIGHFFSLVVPGGLGLDGARAFYSSRLNAGRRHEALSSIVFDRIVGFGVLCLLAAAFGGALLGHGIWASVAQRYVVIAASLSALILLAAVALSSRAVRAFWHARVWTPAAKFLDAAATYRHHPWSTMGAIALAVLGHSSSIAAAYCCFVAIGEPAEVLKVCAISPIVSFSRFVALTPMGIGVIDVVADTLYSAVQIDGGAEVIIILRVITLLLAGAFGLAYLIPVPSGVFPGDTAGGDVSERKP